jgi:hypothetical protein
MAKAQTRAAAPVPGAVPGVYVSNQDFYVNGATLVLAGHTVAEGHPIMRGREHLFRPFVPTFALSEADADAAAKAQAEADAEAAAEAEAQAQAEAAAAQAAADASAAQAEADAKAAAEAAAAAAEAAAAQAETTTTEKAGKAS